MNMSDLIMLALVIVSSYFALKHSGSQKGTRRYNIHEERKAREFSRRIDLAKDFFEKINHLYFEMESIFDRLQKISMDSFSEDACKKITKETDRILLAIIQARQDMEINHEESEYICEKRRKEIIQNLEKGLARLEQFLP